MFVNGPKEEYRQTAEDTLEKLKQLDSAPGITYGVDSRTGHRYNIDRFTAKMRERMMDTERAIAEDEKILERVRRKLDVDKN